MAVSKDGLQFRFVIPGTRSETACDFAFCLMGGISHRHTGRSGSELLASSQL